MGAHVFKPEKPSKSMGIFNMRGGTAHLTERCSVQRCLYITRFNDLEHFWRTGNDMEPTTHEHTSSRRSGRGGRGDDWGGTDSWEEAYGYGINGWDEGVTKMRKVLKCVKTDRHLFPSDEECEEYDVYGDEVDMGRYMGGEPECMVTQRVVETQDGSHIKISVNCVASWTVATKSIIARGTAVCALVSKLEEEGYTTELIAYEFCNGAYGNGHQSLIEVPVKRPEDYLNEERVAMALGSSAMLRRGFFAINERMPEGLFDMCYGGGYGSVSNPSKDQLALMGYTYNMNAINNRGRDGEPAWKDAKPAEIAEWVGKKWTEIVEEA